MAALQSDESHKDTVTSGELITQAVAATPAPSFKGDVLTVTGDQDIIFCHLPGCGNVANEGQFYPAARSVDFGESSASHADSR